MQAVLPGQRQRVAFFHIASADFLCCKRTLTLALRFVLLGLVALLGACASVPETEPQDPWESFNRPVSRFNDAMDRAVTKPLAHIYAATAPGIVRTGIDNFFANLGDAWSAFNAVLQLKPKAAGENSMRFLVNTVFGFGGLLDWASEIGIPRTKKDFGQTLGRWGVGSGPYVVLPLLGPSSVRDGSGFLVDTVQGDLLGRIADADTYWILVGTRLINVRASLMRAESLVDGAALDKYSFTRDAYLQYRQGRVEAAQEPEDETDSGDPSGPSSDPLPGDPGKAGLPTFRLW